MAWRAVIDGVLEARADFHLKQMPLGGVSGPRMLGVVHDAVIFLLEQLQGAANCKQHRFRFHRCEDTEEELPINPSGCARSEIYSRCGNRRPGLPPPFPVAREQAQNLCGLVR